MSLYQIASVFSQQGQTLTQRVDFYLQDYKEITGLNYQLFGKDFR